MEKSNLLKAEYEGIVKIGDLIMPCCVLEDETRVLSQRGLQRSLGLSEGGGKGGARKIPQLMDNLSKKGIHIRGLDSRANLPISYISLKGSGLSTGYDAMILPDICAVIIDASRKGKLSRTQLHLGDQAAMLQHGLSTLGIVGLVDEATGYQAIRDKRALETILDRFLLKELAAWAKRFPDEFYKEMFRLRDWPWDPSSVSRPSIVGKYTNDIVYERIAPGLLEELKLRIPKNEHGKRKGNLQQMLTEDVGHPALAQHLHAVIGLMRASAKWDDFYRLLQRAFPKKGDHLELLLD